MEQQENLVGVLKTLWQWRKNILKVVALAAIGSVVVSLLMPTYYKSTTTFYAASQDLFKPEQLFGGADKDLNYYGTDADIDRLLTIANSHELLDYLVAKYKLYEHYDIDSTGTKAKAKMRKRFFKQYNVLKTKYDAIELSVEDVDPIWAAQIANDARNKIDEIAQKLIKGSQYQLIESIKIDIVNQRVELMHTGDSLANLRKRYGIYDLSSGEVLAGVVAEAEANYTRSKAKLESLEKDPTVPKDSIALIRATARGFEEELKSLTSESGNNTFNINKFNSGISNVTILTQMHGALRDRISRNINRMSELQGAYDNKTSAVHIIEVAQLPYEKSRPIRSLIVLTSILVAFIFTIIAILLLDKYQGILKQIRE